MQTFKRADDSIGRGIQRVGGIRRVRGTEAGQAECDDVKPAGKARRDVVEDMRIGAPSMEQHEWRTGTAPIEVLKPMAPGADQPDTMGRWVTPHRCSRIDPLRCAHRRPSEDEDARPDMRAQPAPMRE